MPGIFACYRFPPGGQGKSQEFGELPWYFLPDGSNKVLTTVDEINRHIASEPATPRPFFRPLKIKRNRLKAIEAHIRSCDLKARKSITMAQGGTSGDAGQWKRTQNDIIELFPDGQGEVRFQPRPDPLIQMNPACEAGERIDGWLFRVFCTRFLWAAMLSPSPFLIGH